MIYDGFLNYIDEGRKGLNKGIPMGFSRLDKFLRGVQKKKYYLVGANTGVGKTAFVDQAFIINPYNWIKLTNAKESLKVFYYTFEIDIESKLSKWVSYQLFIDHRIEIDPERILGMDMQHENDVENRLDDETYALIKDYKAHFEKMFEFIELEDVPLHPTAIFNQVKNYFEENGKWIEFDRTVGGKTKKIKYYKPNNKDEYVIIIIDHVGLVKSEKASKTEGMLTKKGTIDRLSSYLIELRNKYKAIPVVVSQFNREMGDIQRQRFKELTPQLEDFKDSGSTQEDCNVAIALFSPARYNIPRYLDYDLKTPKHDVSTSFRAGFVVKNRGGRDGAAIGFRFLGHCGYFEELPQAKQFEEEPEMYKIIEDFSQPFSELAIEVKNKTYKKKKK
jgi:KaiC/GvpD/RAD55 family RecA-like ATPase